MKRALIGFVLCSLVAAISGTARFMRPEESTPLALDIVFLVSAAGALALCILLLRQILNRTVDELEEQVPTIPEDERQDP